MIYRFKYLVLVAGLCSCVDGGHQIDAGPMDACIHDAEPPLIDAEPPLIDASPPRIDAGPPRLDAFWTAIPADGPGLRENAGLAFDSVTQRLILFGGCLVRPDGGCGMVNDVWVLDVSNGLSGARWTQLSPAGVPPTVTPWGIEVSYDPTSGRLLAVIRGLSANELWALENANGLGTPRWRPISLTGTEAPSFRGKAAVDYDPDRNVLYMFGGLAQEDLTALGDMWMLENANGVEGSAQWRALLREGAQPAARTNHSGFLDPSGAQMFIFGGSNNAGTVFSDGWTLDLARPVTARRLIDDLPSNIVADVAGYDSERRELLFLGCRGGTNACRFGAVWHLRLDNETEPLWEVILPEDEDAPFAWSAVHSSVYDAESDRFFFFSSANEAGEPLHVLWVLSNASAQ